MIKSQSDKAMSTESELRQSDQMEELLDKHAEYYIRETMKFFQNKGESPALSRDNDGDCEAKASIQALITRREQEAEAALILKFEGALADHATEVRIGNDLAWRQVVYWDDVESVFADLIKLTPKGAK